MRGYQKRIIHLKNTGSDMFEEAYFVVKETVTTKGGCEGHSIIDEANRIIEENCIVGKRKNGSVGERLLCVAIGAAVASIVYLITIII